MDENIQITGSEQIPESTQTPVNTQIPANDQMPENGRSMLDLNRSWNFNQLVFPCAIYALIFPICMFRNWSGVMTPVWIASTIFLVAYLMKKTGKSLKKGSIFLITIMMLIGISCFCTANVRVLLTNYLAEFLLLMTLILHNYADDSQWDLAKHLGEIFNAVFGALSLIGTPFTDGKAFFDNRKSDKKSKAGAVLAGILIALPTCIVLGLILASADAVFENLFVRLFEEIISWQNILGLFFMFAFGFFSSYCGMRQVQAEGPQIRVREVKKSEPVIAITVTSIVALLYLVFSAVQILFLFIGGFELPENISYAEYARRGFFQLLAVSVMNLAVVLILKKYIRKSKALNAILIVICVCTYIMIASSAIRMLMYIRAYNLTMDRISVLFALLTLAVLLIGVIILILKDDFSFRRFCIAAVSVIYIPFAFLNADALIARYNLANNNMVLSMDSTRRNYHYDYYYISSLSADAAPAILDYFEEKGLSGADMIATDWYIEFCNNNKIDGEFVGIRQFNTSKFRANKILPIPPKYKPFA